MKTEKKFIIAFIAILLCLLLTAVCIFSISKKTIVIEAKERNIVLSDKIKNDSVLNTYEDSSFELCGMSAIFTGYQDLDVSAMSQIDYISDVEVEMLKDCKVKYTYTYDVETNLITLSAEMHNEIGNIEIDKLSGLAFLNEKGKVDAVLVTDDGENIMLSEMIDAGMVDNVGWLSRLFKAVVVAVTVVAAVAITVATAGTGAAAAVALTTAVVSTTVLSVQESVQANSNYNNNKKLDSKVNGLINAQKYYSDWKFGVRTLDYNGCGVIATYNIMFLLGKKQNLSRVAYDIESKQGALVWGFAGTDPTHPYEYFTEKGIAAKKYYNQNDFDSALKNMRNNQYAMVCYWNNKNNIGDGAHFVAVSKAGNNYQVYNPNNICVDLSKIMNQGKGCLIAGLIVN